MIVISQNFVLGAGDPPLTNPVIGWHSLAIAGNIEATSFDEAYPPSNLANPSTNAIWRALGDSPAEPVEYLSVTVAGEYDYLAIARHNFGSTQATLSVEGLLDPDESPEDWFELVQGVIPADDAPILFRFTKQALAAIRLKIEVGSGVPECAVLYAGELLVFQRGVQGDYTPLPYARETNVVTGFSESGNFIGRIVTGAKVSSAASFIGFELDWMRSHLDPFLARATELPFFFAWCPEDYPDEVGYAWLDNDAKPIISVDGYASIDLQMTGILR